MLEPIRTALVNGIMRGQNAVVSPLSLKFGGAMLFHACCPLGRMWIEKGGIGDISDEAIRADLKRPMRFANAVWYQPSKSSPTEAYTAVLERIFHITPQPIDVGDVTAAAARINAYARGVTDGTISGIVEDWMLHYSQAVVLSAASIQVSWSDSFKSTGTGKGYFEGASYVQYMNKCGEVLYGCTHHAESVLLNREDGGTVQIVLPNEGVNLLDLVDDLEMLLSMRHDPSMVMLALPHVKVGGWNNYLDLLDFFAPSLPGLSIEGFAPIMQKSAPVDVYQAATVQWSETGVRKDPDLRVNDVRRFKEVMVTRPFLFIIRESDGSVSFAGVIYRPQGWPAYAMT